MHSSDDGTGIMRIQLSASTTGFWRTFPFIWAGAGLASSRHLRTVWLEDDSLIVRIPGGEHAVPLTSIEDVSESWLVTPKTITVRIRLSSGETQDIMFAANGDGASLPFGEHGTVRLLRERIEEARTRLAQAQPAEDA